MARIAGVNLPTNKRVVIALQYIHGIGPKIAQDIMGKVNLPRERRVSQLTDAEAGGSMGGMQVLQWAASYPQRVFSALPIACATRHSAQNIAFHEVGRQAIMADPEWRRGCYDLDCTFPRRGLAVARMGAHITYLSDVALHRKFGRKFHDRENPTFSFDADFEVESYLQFGWN